MIRDIKINFYIVISKTSIYKILKDNKIKKKQIYRKILLTHQDKRNKQIKEFMKKTKNLLLDSIISIDESSADSYIDHKYGWSKSQFIKLLS